jgi:hypothetical protein
MVWPLKEVRMRTLSRFAVVFAVLVLVVTAAAASDLIPQELDRRPDAALGAAVGNVVFLPVRLAVTTVGGVLGGFTGFMTAGNHDAADDVWDLFQGQNILTPDIVEGKEALRFGYMEFTATGPPR